MNYLTLIKLVIILFLIYLILKQNNLENFYNFNKKYKRCDQKKITGLLNSIFEENNIVKTKNNDWDIYVPCGYNLVEQELKNIYPISNKQIIFGISGCDKIVSKNNIWSLLENKYGRRYASLLMPETFIINRDNDMNIFSKKFNNKNIYILKKNIQRKRGLKISNNYQDIIQSIKDGYKVIQYFDQNTYMIDNHKMNLRVFILIVCQYGNIRTYIHKLGKCLYAPKKYNKNNKLEFESNVTNSYKMNSQNLPVSFIDLKKHLKFNNYDYNKLFKNIDVLMQKIAIAYSNNLCKLDNIKNNLSFQLFGADIIFNKHMVPKLLEINKGPDMNPKDKIDANLKKKIEIDMLNIVKLININDPKYVNQFYEI